MTCTNVKVGDRIVLLSMPDDPYPIQPGDEGTVIGTAELWGEQIASVKWDSGRTLSVVLPHDKVRVIE